MIIINRNSLKRVLIDIWRCKEKNVATFSIISNCHVPISIGYKIRLKNRFVLAPSLRLSGFDLRTFSIGWYAITAEPNRCTVKHDYFGFNVRDIQ